MLGGFVFKLMAKRVEYKLNIKRKITKVIGKSATGKSELVRLLNDFEFPHFFRFKCYQAPFLIWLAGN